MRQVRRAVLNNFAALAVAPTGKGKTVVALWLAAVLGVKMLVIVPTSEIMRGWIEEAERHLGIKAGVCQQDRCEIAGVTVALIHSLACRTYDREFYDAFGLVVWDEAHTTGAYTFQRTLGMFRSKYKLALTATPTRKDGAEALFLNYFGAGYARQREKAYPCLCYTVVYGHEHKKWPGNQSVLINILAQTQRRNEFCAKWVHWLYRKRGHVLGLSDRIDQLEAVRAMLIERGVPDNHIGIVAAQRAVGTKTVYKPTKKVLQGKRYWYEHATHGWQEVRVKMRLPRKCIVVFCDDNPVADYPAEMDVPGKLLHDQVEIPVRRKTTPEELRKAKLRRILLGIYKLCGMGFNVPRLLGGMDLTPRATGEQPIGRIRRQPNPPQIPIWVTPIDKGMKKLEGFAHARIREYRKCNVTVMPYAKRKAIRRAH